MSITNTELRGGIRSV